ncbi:MAG: NUDIX hydrolase [Methylocystaceae bacterium]
MKPDYNEQLKRLKERKPQILGHESTFKSAVLLPLVNRGGEDCVLFEKRALSLDHQPGEICFPGGKVEDTDKDPEQTAIRETCEELGIKPSQVELLAALDIMVSPFNLIVYPFVGRLTADVPIRPNRDEVGSIFCVPLSYLLTADPLRSKVKLEVKLPPNYPLDLIPGGREYPWRRGSYPQLFYEWQDKIIWGMTARILEHFLTLLT